MTHRIVAGLVAYDGGGFRGFAINAGVRTVGGDLTAALGRVLREPVTLTVAGRTDAGVHAWGQVVSFRAAASADLARVQRSLNAMLRPAIAVRALAWAPPGFDARFSAQRRTYRYHLLTTAAPDPFLAATTWHVPEPLDLTAMGTAAGAFVGEHDFRSFCRRRVVQEDGLETEAPTTRVVSCAGLIGPDERGVVCFEIEANAFCHQMVRSITGTLVDIGRGRRRADAVAAMLAARDRHAAGGVAPPHGLTLWHVDYGAAWPFAGLPPAAVGP